jgi:lipoprotein signal peptidase
MKNLVSKLLSRPNLTIAATGIFVFVTILLDQALKSWALGLSEPTDFLFFRFYPYGNSGVIGGYLSGLDPWIIRIFFSVSGWRL